MTKRSAVLGIAAVAVFATAATAALQAPVHFDPATGEGKINRGAVITQLGKGVMQQLDDEQNIVVSYGDQVRITETCTKYHPKKPEVIQVQQDRRRTRNIRNRQNILDYETKRAPGNENLVFTNLNGFDFDDLNLPETLCPQAKGSKHWQSSGIEITVIDQDGYIELNGYQLWFR